MIKWIFFSNFRKHWLESAFILHHNDHTGNNAKRIFISNYKTWGVGQRYRKSNILTGG